MEIEIKLKNGLGQIEFGCSTEKVHSSFGSPDEIEQLENPTDGTVESVVWSYNNLGLNFFFDVTGTTPELCTIESDNLDTKLMDCNVFKENIDTIKAVMSKNGYDLVEEDEEVWGEKRYTFDDAQIDFYYDRDELTMVSWSHY